MDTTGGRVTKVQGMSTSRSCLHCNGAKQIVVKSASGTKTVEPCPVCNGSGMDGIIIK